MIFLIIFMIQNKESLIRFNRNLKYFTSKKNHSFLKIIRIKALK